MLEMKSLFEKVCEIVTPVDVTGMNMTNHFKVVRAVKAACQECQPGAFSALMIYAQVAPKFPGLTHKDVRDVIEMFEKNMEVANVGDIRQGHVMVPAYVVRSDAWQ